MGRLRTIWANLAVIVLLLVAVAFGYLLHAVQASRKEACARTYEGARELFLPFRSRSTAARWRLFDDRVNELKAQCPTQTELEVIP